MSKKIARTAMLIAVAMIFSYVEAMIPVNLGIPGAKLGLANIVILVAIYLVGEGDALLISIVRVILSGFLFGNVMGIAYSLAGGILSYVSMIMLKKLDRFSVVGVSVAGGIMHNVGQLVVAIIFVKNISVAFYLPFLMVLGMITGMVIGILGFKIIDVLEKNGEIGEGKGN